MASKRTVVLGRARQSTRTTIPRRLTTEPAPASLGQEQIWLHSQLAPDLPLYTESLTVHRIGPLDAEALAAGFREIVRRHEIWRTTFHWSHERLVQHVHTELEPPLRMTDLRHLPEDARESAAIALALEDLRRPFDLTREAGVRAHLVTLSGTDHRLYLCLHHMVFDGISIYRVFLPELAALYHAYVEGTASGLDEPSLQYADFAYWQRSTLDEGRLKPLVAYWQGQLSGAPTTIDLPADHPRPGSQSFRGGLVRFEISHELADALARTALRENCTLFMLLLAAFAVTLHSWSGQTDMLIGSVSGGREHPELERLIGYFLRVIVIRGDLRGNPPFREALYRVRESLVDALSHDALPFQRLIQALPAARDLGRSPLFQVTFSIEPPLPAVGPEWDLSEMDTGETVSKFDLSIELEHRSDCIRGRAIYSSDLFEASTISDLLSDYTMVLRAVVADPGQTLQQLTAFDLDRRLQRKAHP